jgi:hypothetical protein
VDMQVRTYHWALRQTKLPRATYIFTDFDRLGPWELELAARLRNLLVMAGVRTLNDPGRARQRFSMLKILQAKGINDFRVWRPEDNEEPEGFPVFLRTQSAHRGVIGDLLHTPEDARLALQAALSEGYTLKDLMFVEYCAEELKPGLFRKLAGFKIGDQMVPALCVHEDHWAAKYGAIGIAGQELYDDEADIVRTNRYGEALRPAFEAAHIDYGRADFGIVKGKPQIYEINTNPDVKSIGDHPFAIRLEADKQFLDGVGAALAAVDTPAGGVGVALDDPIFKKQRRGEFFLLRERHVV